MIYSEEGEDVYITVTVYERETGLPRRQITTLNGLKHAPPDGSPSHIAFDDEGRPLQKHWHAFDKEHREEGPSTIMLYSDTGIHMTERFMLEDKPRSADQGPYRIRRNRDGEITKEEFAPLDSSSADNPFDDFAP